MSPRRKARIGPERKAGTAESSPGRMFWAEEAEGLDIEWKLWGVGSVSHPGWSMLVCGKLEGTLSDGVLKAHPGW